MKKNKWVKVVVRKVGRREKLYWASLRRALWPQPVSIHMKEIEVLLKKRGFICVIAWNGNTPVGFAEAMIRPFANGCEGQPVPFLEGLYVSPAYRRNGVGHELVKKVEAWALKRGFRELGSDAYLSAVVSHKAHGAYGFKETERVVYFRKVLAHRKAAF